MRAGPLEVGFDINRTLLLFFAGWSSSCVLLLLFSSHLVIVGNFVHAIFIFNVFGGVTESHGRHSLRTISASVVFHSSHWSKEKLRGPDGSTRIRHNWKQSACTSSALSEVKTPRS